MPHCLGWGREAQFKLFLSLSLSHFVCALGLLTLR